VIEVIARTGDLPSPSKIGFMNVTTWADSKETASVKIRQHVESFGSHLVSVDEAEVIDENTERGEDVADMIGRTRKNTQEPECDNSWNVSYLQDKLIDLVETGQCKSSFVAGDS
jgi:hypothetical protein